VTVTSSPAFLYDVRAGKAVPAEVLDKIGDEQLADWETLWMPELFEALKRLRDAGVAVARWPQSRHWNWKTKAAAIKGLLAYPSFAVMAEGQTQGLMMADTTQKCRIDSQKGKPLIYVPFVENAPWNRPELAKPPRFRGVGSILIRAAIELSQNEEFKGRVGLHSLPQANNFYANTCGMTDLGLEDADETHKGLRYFEMTPEQADAFLKKGG
jgi:hypothetical protein